MAELPGGRVNYYLVTVAHPQREDQAPYKAECEDIIEALEMTFDEANIFKEIWRTANARLGNGKLGNTPLRAAEKYVHYSGRILRRARREANAQSLNELKDSTAEAFPGCTFRDAAGVPIFRGNPEREAGES